jgi:hypothetical protein
LLNQGCARISLDSRDQIARTTHQLPVSPIESIRHLWRECAKPGLGNWGAKQGSAETPASTPESREGAIRRGADIEQLAIVADTQMHFDWPAADGAILDVGLVSGRAID